MCDLWGVYWCPGIPPNKSWYMLIRYQSSWMFMCAYLLGVLMV
uniref:Uncharacterized protein n=1 Tax=Arundo donax TaxID=35708 RepID=A0A0A9ECI8_ARUDO